MTLAVTRRTFGGMRSDTSQRSFGVLSHDIGAPGSLRLRPTTIGAALLACGLSLAVGLATVSTQGRLGLAVLAGAIGVLALWRWNVGVLLGAILLAQVGGLGDHPSKSVETLIFTGGVLVLIVQLLVRRPSRLTRAEWYVFWAAGLGLAWWTLIAIRTIVVDGGTIPGVLGGGRDLAYIYIVAPLSMLVLKNHHARRGLVGALAVGAALYLVAWLLYSSGNHQLGALLNIQHVASVYGISRLYTPTHYIGNLAACFGIALALRGPTPPLRRLGAIFAAAALLVVVLQLTRAAYFGLGIGTVVVCGAWALQSRSAGQRLFQGRVLIALAALAVLVTGLILVPVAEESTLGKVSQRVNAGIENLENGTGSVGLREEKAAAIINAMDGNSLTGIGFWTPSVRYFSGVPEGEIRDGDLGVLNIYATEGLVGVIILYLPLLGLLVFLTAFPSWGGLDGRSSKSRLVTPREEDDRSWLMLGAGIWLAMVLASSITLGDLSSRPGASVSGYVIGTALAVLVTTPSRWPVGSWTHGDSTP